ncbi:MAG: diguanylate cyclase [Chromatiaceae bacterium]|nr:diguanylate cyclase [Chromatiaceae bacterium]
MAHHDPLTNLPQSHPVPRTPSARTRPGLTPGLAWPVIFVDLDHFKHVNDSLSHSYGDRLLIEVAEVLSSGCATEDTVEDRRRRVHDPDQEVSDRNQLTSVIEKIIEAFTTVNSSSVIRRSV